MRSFTRAVVVLGLAAAAVGAAARVMAEALDQAALDHVDAAVAGGLEPHDYHHLLFALGWRQLLADRSTVEQILDRLGGTGGDPLMVAEVRRWRGLVAVDEGRPAAAREVFRTLGGLEQWWALGPSSLEELPDFAAQARLPEPGGSWRPVPGTDALGWVRLSGLAWPAQRQMLYLATTVTSPVEQPVAVRLGASQVARAWLNGVEVLTTPHPLEHREDQAVGGGWFRAGANSLVVAVASEDDDWWLRVRLTAPDGSSLEGVREVDRPPTLAPTATDGRAPPPVRSLEAEIRRAVRDRERGADVALAALLVARRPLAADSGAARAACQDARGSAPAWARYLEWLLTSEPGAARDLLQGALAADPDFALARPALARWLHDRGLFEAAQEVLDPVASEPAMRATALNLESRLWSSVVLPEMGALSRQWPRCVEAAAVLAESSRDASWWWQVDEALARLEATVPGLGRVLELRARVAEACGDGAVLREVLQTRLDRDPNLLEARIRLARLLAAEGDRPAARDLLTAGLGRCPDHPDLLLELARLEHAVGDDEAAAQLARQLLRVRPQERRAERLLELLGHEAGDRDWLRATAELWSLAEKAPQASPAVVLLDHHEIRLLPGNLTEERVQRAVLITAGDQAESFSRRVIPYVPERQRLRVLAARILRRDGSEVSARQGDTPRLTEPEINTYYDTRLRVLSFAELEDGDLVEVSYELTEVAEANETGPYSGGIINLAEEVPVVVAEVELAGPPGELPAWELVHISGEPQRQDGTDGLEHLRWQWQDLEATPRDLPPAPRLLVSPHLVYSNHPEWSDLADWYARHVEPRVRPSRQVQELAQRLVAGIDDRRRRIAAVYRFVTNEVRYVALELGEHRFRPFSADWVLNHKIGDCKDKGALLAALFNAIDVPADMVLVRTADQGPLVARLANLESFNHVIVYLPEDDLWLDGTASGHDPFVPPGIDQGAAVLVVRGAASELETTPVVGAGTSRLRYTLTRGSDGAVTVVVRSEDTGDAASRRRGALAGSNDPRRFASWLQRQFPGAELTEDPVFDLQPSRDPVFMELTASVPRAVLQSGGGIPTYPGRLDLLSRLVPSAERRTPLWLTALPDLEWTLEVQLDRAPISLPEGVRLDTPYGYLHLELAEEGSGYRIEGELHLNPGLVPSDQTGALRDFLREVERYLTRPLEVP